MKYLGSTALNKQAVDWMNTQSDDIKSTAESWGEFRFSVIGHLLCAPPCRGELRAAIKELSRRNWRHPITGTSATFAFSTIERWFYTALREKRSPVQRLSRRVRSDNGTSRRMKDTIVELLGAQYKQHPSWSKKLHADNLRVALADSPNAVPSYQTISRFMNRHGLVRRSCSKRAGHRAALSHLDSFEVRSFESEYVGALLHLDFHHCSQQVITKRSGWATPIALAVMDDCSRFICHLQWYLAEQTEDLVHGVTQALLKVGLPRALMSDNGSAMTSLEFIQGLRKLGILHSTTLPYSPYQNGKQERFFGSLEGRLIAMCEGLQNLTLERLNLITQAWLEMEYSRAVNRELGVTPARKFLDTKQVFRPCSSLDELRMAFRRRIIRRQRRTDNTVSIDGTRFEIPYAYRTLQEVAFEYAAWDMSFIHLVERKTGSPLCQIFPVDKAANSSGERRKLTTATEVTIPVSSEEPPLLRKLLEDFAATGLPPAYIPKPEKITEK